MTRDKMANMMFEEFLYNNSWAANDVRYWYSSGPFEVTIKLNDGTMLYYDYHTKVTTIINPYDTQSENEWKRHFSARLKQKMYYRGISQQDMASRLGVTAATVSRYMNSKSIPDAFMLRRIANVLECSITELTDI